jgi:hypothetical protein
MDWINTATITLILAIVAAVIAALVRLNRCDHQPVYRNGKKVCVYCGKPQP